MARDARRLARAGAKLVTSRKPFVHPLVEISGSGGAIPLAACGGRLSEGHSTKGEKRQAEKEARDQPRHGNALMFSFSSARTGHNMQD
jgi:hypothetical protein